MSNPFPSERWRDSYDALLDRAPDPGRVVSEADETQREQDWADAMREVEWFLTKYGVGATMRMIGEVLSSQRGLFK